MDRLKAKLESVARAVRGERQATLPWRQLEAEAARQGCSAADILFDRAGRGLARMNAGRGNRQA